jgi:cytochrome c biogenesis protein CcdA/thiol-disulfide isomerase/thioredoxin
MLLALLAYLGGVLTIISPCILPVLPFVFARQGRSFVRTTLPLVAGMAITFSAIATLAAVGGGWALRVNSYARVLALAFLIVFGVALVSQRLSDWISRPIVSLGNRLMQANEGKESVLPSLILGVATGLLWAPCAGPILGVILTGAAISGPNTQTSLLLLAYGLGAATSLALATVAGARVFRAMKLSLGTTEWLRRALGVAVLIGAVAIINGWDTGLLTRISLASTNSVEQKLLDAVRGRESGSAPANAMAGGAMSGGGAMRSGGAMNGGAMRGGAAAGGAMRGGAMSGAMSGKAAGASSVQGQLPPLSGAVAWLNSAPLTAEALRGKVVMIDFWTYSCINCLRTLPYLRAWQQRYHDLGFTIVGVHTPEFAFEKDKKNVERAVHDLGVTYPVAIDNDYAIWRAFNNEYWPAHYFVDAKGHIRGHHFGEGGYDESEQLIRSLLTEAGVARLPAPTGALKGSGVEFASDESDVSSPETYIGHERAQNFASPGGFAPEKSKAYALPSDFQLNDWALAGAWTDGAEFAVSDAPNTKIAFRFHARDLHLVLGPAADGKPVRFRVTIDGHPPGDSRGVDVDAKGEGVVREQRLYQLIRQTGGVQTETFTIEFLDPGVQAYSFTFG